MEPLSEDIEENLDRMVVESLEAGCLWGLCDSQGNWAVVPSADNEALDVMPLWSDRDLAQRLCCDDWTLYQPVAIDMEEFLDDWLPAMHTDLLLVGVNWNEDLDGEEYEPLDLLEEFENDIQ